MTLREKLNLLEEMLDLETGSLNGDERLEDIEQWDSIAVISFIALVDEVFGRVIQSRQVKELKTVKDLTDIMN